MHMMTHNAILAMTSLHQQRKQQCWHLVLFSFPFFCHDVALPFFLPFSCIYP